MLQKARVVADVRDRKPVITVAAQELAERPKEIQAITDSSIQKGKRMTAGMPMTFWRNQRIAESGVGRLITATVYPS